MLTRLYRRSEVLKNAFLSGKSMIIMGVGFCIAMLGYPDAITAHEFHTFGVPTEVYLAIGGGIMLLVFIPAVIFDVTYRVLENRAFFCERGEPWPHPRLNLCDEPKGCTCA